jgi:hypothetical protein
MNRLVIIGNGFDMAHGLKTSYMDFINWYWERRLNAMLTERTAVSEDCLCKLQIINTKECSSWSMVDFNSCWDIITGKWKTPPSDIICAIRKNTNDFSVTYSPFFEAIQQSIETKGWVDIENDYYQILKQCTENDDRGYSVKELNGQLGFLQSKLVEYLGTLTVSEPISTILKAIKDNIHVEDLSTEGKALAKTIDNSIEFDPNSFDDTRYMTERFSGLEPEHIMLLCFNYTATAKLYEQCGGLILNYIHGDLEQPEHIIFGYGDELDKDYQNIVDRNNNELLKNVKSVKYLETRNYHKMLDFLMAAPFQVLIMGHSCGNSDRTLLNTVFEHENCVSIKPFYHKWEDGSDNYLELVQNISRNFTNMKLFRDRVVNKEQCKTM